MMDVRFAQAIRRYHERPGTEMWQQLAKLYRIACEFNEITPNMVKQYVEAKTAEERRRAAEARTTGGESRTHAEV